MFDTSKLRGRIIEKFGSQGKFAAEIKRSQAFVSEVLMVKPILNREILIHGQIFLKFQEQN